MSALRGALGGALSLIALQAVVSSTSSANRVGGLFSDLASIVERGLSPNVALIPDLRPASAGGTERTSTTKPAAGTGTAQLPSSQFDPSSVPVPPPVIAPSSQPIRTT